MSVELERFRSCFERLEERIDEYERHLATGHYSERLCEDIYSAIYRLGQRFESKKKDLEPHEARALSKFFEQDVFYRDRAAKIRRIVDHVVTFADVDGYLEVRTPERKLVLIGLPVSAAQILDKNEVSLPAFDEYREPINPFELDHSELFRYVRERIGVYLRQADSAQA